MKFFKFSMMFHKFIFILSFSLLFYQQLITTSYSAPSTTLSISPSAVDATTITASDENTRNNSISTTFNNHSHTDITQTGNTLAVGDAAAGNKTITANNADSNKPFIRYDDTADNFVFSMNGTTNSMVLSGTLLTFEGNTDDAFETTISITDPTADRTVTVPNTSFTVGDMTYSNTRAKVGSFTRDTTAATGTQTVTGVGFTPIGFALNCFEAATAEASWGLTDCSTSAAIYDNNTITTDTYGNGNLANDIHSSGNTYTGDLSSCNSDGFVISWTKVGSPSGTLTCLYYAIR